MAKLQTRCTNSAPSNLLRHRSKDSTPFKVKQYKRLPASSASRAACCSLSSPLKLASCRSSKRHRQPSSPLDGGLPTELGKKEEEKTQSETKYTAPEVVNTDPQGCSQYASDIDAYLRVAEKRGRASTTYIKDVQQHITKRMRKILVDWLVDVALLYKLSPDTLYLCVSCIDRYLSKKSVNKQSLQLLGITCMLIASKYMERDFAPTASGLCYVTHDAYVPAQVLHMESDVLQCLNYDVSFPTVKTFLRSFIPAAALGTQIGQLRLEYLADFIAELTLVEYSFIAHLPSLVAASAIFLAKFSLNPFNNPWNPTLLRYTGYQPSQLKACVEAVQILQTKQSTENAIRSKYANHVYGGVCNVETPAPIPADYFVDVCETVQLDA